MTTLNTSKKALLILATLAALLLWASPAAAADATELPIGEPGEEEGEGFTSLTNPDEDLQATLVVANDKDNVEQYIAIPDEELCPNCCSTCCVPLPGGLDHVAAGTGTRNAGFGTIGLRGAPDGAVVVRATLYWGNLEINPALTQTINFQGQVVTGNLIGVTTEPCWNPNTVFAAYSASVINLIYPAIDGDYQVSGLPTAISSSRNPWANPNRPTPDTGAPMTNGASLVVEYSHASVPLGSRVYTHTGPWYFAGNTINLNHILNPAPTLVNFLRHTRIGGDGQIGGGVTPAAGTSNEATFINGFQIRGPGAPANQDSDWNGHDGGPLNKLWDTQTSDVTGTIAAGAGAYTVTYTSNGDCVVPVVHVLTAR